MTDKNCSSNVTELFYESQAIRKQNVAQLSKLLVDYGLNSKRDEPFTEKSTEIITEKIHDSILKSFVEIKFEICGQNAGKKIVH